MERQNAYIIPKEQHLARWQTNTILLALLVLALCLMFAYFFLQQQMSSLREELITIENENYLLQAERAKNLYEMISEKASLSGSFLEMLQNRENAIKAFDFLKEVCHKRSQILQLNLDVDSNILILNMRTESFKTLGEQILILKNDQRIAQFETYDIALDKEEDEVEFAARLIFANNFFNSQL